MDIDVVCNTSDEVLGYNIRQNSLRKVHEQWVKMQSPHDGHACLVGSGPSLKDCLDVLRWRKDQGQHIFALNNAANYLHDQGFEVDCQVIIDARPQSVQLIGPARIHYFASQVDPELFEREPEAALFHPAYDDIDKYLPPYNKSYALIGGGTTVGLSAMALVFTLGYRKLHLFGYDSCHREDESHVVPQKINDDEPWGIIEWNGRKYKGSLTMLRQAELFQTVANNLIDMGCTITVDGSGLIPDMVRQAPVYMSEKEKYRKMWEFEEYRQVAPGEHLVDLFMKVTKAQPDDTVTDFGCGTGRGGARLRDAGLNVLLVDFVENSRDEEASGLPFVQADLYKPLPPRVTSRFGYCTDVLEHIRTEDLDAVINNIMMTLVHGCFFQVSHVEDRMGALIGQILHLTVKPADWWLDKFCALGYSLRHVRIGEISSTFFVTHSTT
jgi:SAM-dependent methyltransferase